MFTGIVSEIGVVKSARRLSGGVELEVEAAGCARRLAVGASIAINGVCQTVTETAPPRFRVQAVGATVERTTLGLLSDGARVNIETSLRLGDEIGGHLVTGHADGTARVLSLGRRGEAILLTVELPNELARYAAPRGSIAIDGTSLTVAGVDGARVEIWLIPHTVDNTIARYYRPGVLVNVEADLLARYVWRLLAESERGPAPRLTMGRLKEGFS